MNIIRTPEHQAKLRVWNESQRKLCEERKLRESLNKVAVKEVDLFGQLEGQHDLYWTIAYRNNKTCRLCKQMLPLASYDKAGCTVDKLKHECKQCSYDRYVKPHLPERAARTRAWQKANPEKTKAAEKKHRRKPHMRARHNLVKRLKKLIGSKSERYADLIGCAPKVLVAHLESLFKPGMNWDNTDQWHIDHKIPCRAFDLTKKEQRLRCFHWSNLQPLWAAENTAKSDQMPDGTNARDLTPIPPQPTASAGSRHGIVWD